jgi:hypothetical protein
MRDVVGQTLDFVWKNRFCRFAEWWLTVCSLLISLVSLNFEAIWGKLTTIAGDIIKSTSAAGPRSNETAVLVMADGSGVDC